MRLLGTGRIARRISAIVFGAVLVALWVAPAGAIRNGDPESDPAFNGVGAILPTLTHALCTGTMVSPDIVLTAAQCVRDHSPDPVFEFSLGPGRTARATAIRAHPEYETVTDGIDLAFDLALLRLDREATRSWSDIVPFTMRDGDMDLGVDATAVGFGETSSGVGSGTRNSGTLLVYQYSGWDTPNGFIANAFLEVYPWNGNDQMFCPGDTGGPLVYQGQIAGVASFRNSRTCYDRNPGYYIGLTRFKDWIRTTMLELEGDPPTLSLPANITVDATSPSGAVVTYSASATDPTGPVPFTCSPPSGNTFAIGVTAVSCTTTNEAGTTNGAFQVLVQAAAAQVSNLTATVQSLNLAQGIANSLDAKLVNVVSALSAARAGSSVSTCNQLAAFNNQTVAQSGKQLTVDQANQLMTSANRIKAVIGCP